MSERLRAYALVIPMSMVLLGILTSWTALFVFLGLALYVELMRECFRYTVPWRWLRKALFLGPMKIDNPSPPPPGADEETEEAQVIDLGNGAGYVVYPDGRKRYDA